jgi:hypothetical protein
MNPKETTMFEMTSRLDTEVEAIIGASRGWRYGGPTVRPPRSLAGTDGRAAAVQSLLDALDDELGLRLAERDQVRLRQAPPRHPDLLTDTVLAAEGLDPRQVPALRAEVRMRVADWLLHAQPGAR